MEWVVLGVAIVVALILWRVWAARRIARSHSQTLAHQTGLSPDRIYREMLAHRQTPGEWAQAHGLDPLTFEPVSDDSRFMGLLQRNAPDVLARYGEAGVLGVRDTALKALSEMPDLDSLATSLKRKVQEEGGTVEAAQTAMDTWNIAMAAVVIYRPDLKGQIQAVKERHGL